jgi:hypothetical protein
MQIIYVNTSLESLELEIPSCSLIRLSLNNFQIHDI